MNSLYESAEISLPHGSWISQEQVIQDGTEEATMPFMTWPWGSHTITFATFSLLKVNSYVQPILKVREIKVDFLKGHIKKPLYLPLSILIYLFKNHSIGPLSPFLDISIFIV